MIQMPEEIERIYVIPLRELRESPRWKRAPRAMKVIRNFVSRHMKVEPKSIWIDDKVNRYIWSRGAENIPSKVRVKVIKFPEEEEYVEVTLPED